MVAEGQAMKALLNEAFGSGESSPNPFPFIMELSSYYGVIIEGATTFKAGF